MGMSSTSILFFGITSQDDSDNVAEACRRLGIITDEQAESQSADELQSIIVSLKTYLDKVGLDYAEHGSSDYPIIFFYPKDPEKKWYKETLMRYFFEVNPEDLKPPPKRVVAALQDIADKLGYWGPNWKMVSLLET